MANTAYCVCFQKPKKGWMQCKVPKHPPNFDCLKETYQDVQNLPSSWRPNGPNRPEGNAKAKNTQSPSCSNECLPTSKNQSCFLAPKGPKGPQAIQRPKSFLKPFIFEPSIANIVKLYKVFCDPLRARRANDSAKDPNRFPNPSFLKDASKQITIQVFWAPKGPPKASDNTKIRKTLIMIFETELQNI